MIRLLHEFGTERGSITPIGIFVCVFLCCSFAVTAEARELFILQRQVNAVSDSLALDLADLARIGQSVNQRVALEELATLQLAGESKQMTDLKIASGTNTTRVEVSLCQKFEPLFGLTMLALADQAKVCATSRAVSSDEIFIR